MFDDFGKIYIPTEDRDKLWAFKDFYTIHPCKDFKELTDYRDIRPNTFVKYCIECGKVYIDAPDGLIYTIPKLHINKKGELGDVKWDFGNGKEWFDFQPLPQHPVKKDPIKRQLKKAVDIDSVKNTIANVKIKNYGYWYNDQADMDDQQIFISYQLQGKDYKFRWRTFFFKESYFDNLQEFYQNVDIDTEKELAIALIVKELCRIANKELKDIVNEMGKPLC